MTSSRLRFACVLLTMAAAALFIYRPKSPSIVTAPTISQSVAGKKALSSGLSAEAEQRRITARQLGYGRDWEGDQPAPLAAFREWTRRYLSAASSERPGLETEGVALAQARRPVMKSLIRTNPEQALALTVPAVILQRLPASVLAELESRVAARGELALVASMPAEGTAPSSPALRRRAVLNGRAYTAAVYGRREPQLAQNVFADPSAGWYVRTSSSPLTM
jgi:hypothetical protein